MTNTIKDIIKSQDQQKYATNVGNIMHHKLEFVMIDSDARVGDLALIGEIEKHTELLPFFVRNAQTEVPIAGYLQGVFVSRRIDRMVIDDKNKIISVMDYKTDTDRLENRDKYKKQLSEYKTLLQEVYPGYKIYGYILWLHDWCLEKI